jgi:hypothetical protein
VKVLGLINASSPTGMAVIVLWLAICLAIRWGAVKLVRLGGGRIDYDPVRPRTRAPGPPVLYWFGWILSFGGWVIATLAIGWIFGPIMIG